MDVSTINSLSLSLSLKKKKNLHLRFKVCMCTSQESPQKYYLSAIKSVNMSKSCKHDHSGNTYSKRSPENNRGVTGNPQLKEFLDRGRHHIIGS